MFRQVTTEVALGIHGLNDRIVDAVRRDDLDAGAGRIIQMQAKGGDRYEFRNHPFGARL
jgi:hypothetical protein